MELAWPGGQKYPAAQSPEAEDSPVEEQKEPAGQRLQSERALLPLAALRVPTGQGVGAVDCAGQYDPGGQRLPVVPSVGVALRDCRRQKYPAEHAPAGADMPLAGQYMPPGHGSATLVPLMHTSPAAHSPLEGVGEEAAPEHK